MININTYIGLANEFIRSARKSNGFRSGEITSAEKVNLYRKLISSAIACIDIVLDSDVNYEIEVALLHYKACILYEETEEKSMVLNLLTKGISIAKRRGLKDYFLCLTFMQVMILSESNPKAALVIIDSVNTSNALNFDKSKSKIPITVSGDDESNDSSQKNLTYKYGFFILKTHLLHRLGMVMSEDIITTLEPLISCYSFEVRQFSLIMAARACICESAYQSINHNTNLNTKINKINNTNNNNNNNNNNNKTAFKSIQTKRLLDADKILDLARAEQTDFTKSSIPQLVVMCELYSSLVALMIGNPDLINKRMISLTESITNQVTKNDKNISRWALWNLNGHFKFYLPLAGVDNSILFKPFEVGWLSQREASLLSQLLVALMMYSTILCGETSNHNKHDRTSLNTNQNNDNNHNHSSMNKKIENVLKQFKLVEKMSNFTKGDFIELSAREYKNRILFLKQIKILAIFYSIIIKISLTTTNTTQNDKLKTKINNLINLIKELPNNFVDYNNGFRDSLDSFYTSIIHFLAGIHLQFVGQNHLASIFYNSIISLANNGLTQPDCDIRLLALINNYSISIEDKNIPISEEDCEILDTNENKIIKNAYHMLRIVNSKLVTDPTIFGKSLTESSLMNDNKSNVVHVNKKQRSSHSDEKENSIMDQSLSYLPMGSFSSLIHTGQEFKNSILRLSIETADLNPYLEMISCYLSAYCLEQVEERKKVLTLVVRLSKIQNNVLWAYLSLVALKDIQSCLNVINGSSAENQGLQSRIKICETSLSNYYKSAGSNFNKFYKDLLIAS